MPVVVLCVCSEARSVWPDADTVRARILLLMCAARARRRMPSAAASSGGQAVHGTFESLDHELLSLCAGAVPVTLSFGPWGQVVPPDLSPIGDEQLRQYVKLRRFQRALEALELYVACGGCWNDKLALLWPELFRRRPVLPHVAFINELGRVHRAEAAAPVPEAPEEPAHHVQPLHSCHDGLPYDAGRAVLELMVAFKGPIEGHDGQTKRELLGHAISLLRDEWIQLGMPADAPTYHEFIRRASDVFLEIADVSNVLHAPTAAQVGESVRAKWVLLDDLLRTEWDASSGHPSGATRRELFDSSIDATQVRERLIGNMQAEARLVLPAFEWDASMGAPEPIHALAAASLALGIDPSHCRILLAIDGR